MKYIDIMDNRAGIFVKPGKSFQFFLITFIILIFFAIGFCFADEIQANGSIGPDDIIGPDDSSGYYIDSFPMIIERPGTYYLKPSETAEESGIKILHSDIILDGLGETLNGNMSPGSVGIYINVPKTQASNIIIKNLTIKDFETGTRIEGSTGVVLDDVHFISNTRSGLIIESSENIEIIECSSRNTKNDITGGYGIQVLDSEEVKVKNTLVTGNGNSGKASSGGVIVTNSTAVNIINSQVTSNPGFGIRAERGTRQFVLSQSEISANFGDGINIDSCPSPVIQNSEFNKNKESGIELNKVIQPVIKGNTITQNTLGISIADTEEKELSGNNLKNNRIGFDISASDIRYYNHHVTNSNTIDSRPLLYLNGAHGRKIGSGTNPSMIVLVNSSDISVSDLILSKNCAGIILVNCENITLSSISFMENGMGLRSELGTRNLVLTDLHAERNLLSGYYLSKTKNFTMSSIYGQESPSGIFIQNSADGTCKNLFMSHIYGVKSRLPSGITLCGCDNVTINNSEFSQCSYAGVLSDSKNLELTDNLLISNGFAGSVILSGPVKIHQNSFRNNDDTGLILKADQSFIVRNTFSDNEKQGLLILKGDENLFSENVFNDLNNCNIQDPLSYNTWNGTGVTSLGSFFTGGNYWGSPDGEGFSDLCDAGLDGYCTIPYIIRPGNIDYHPLSEKEKVRSLNMNTDLNQNGYEDLQDVVVYMNKLTSGDTSTLYDFSGDGRINLNDVVALFNIIIKNKNESSEDGEGQKS